MNSLQLCRSLFSHRKTLICSKLSSSEVRFYTVNGRFAYLSSFWELGATYDVSIHFSGPEDCVAMKFVVDDDDDDLGTLESAQ